jgi:hypothetical protein
MPGRYTPPGGGGTVDVTYEGSLFDGSLSSGMDRWRDECEDELGQLTVRSVQAWTDVFFQNPTGYYRGQINAHRDGDLVTVDDGGVVYGPWLNGTGSKNATSSFKGYDHWRLATEDVDRQATAVGTRVLAQYVDFDS